MTASVDVNPSLGPVAPESLVSPAGSGDESESLPRLLCFGLQHVLVMYAGTVAVPLILGAALNFTPRQVIALISADLFTSGLATLLQNLGWWKFGARLPLIQGCSFICVAPMILIGRHYGIPALYGAVISCGLFTILVGPFFSRMLRFFPPVVIGSVITVIGLSLLPVAGAWLGGGDASAPDFGSLTHLGLGFATIALIVVIQRFGRGIIAHLSVLLGLIGCTALTAMAGQAGFRQVPATPWFAMAHPLLFGPPRFVLLPALVMSLSTLVVMTETTGNCLAIGEITGRPIGPATLTAAFRADGLSTMVGGLFNSFPYNVYSQNTGLLKLGRGIIAHLSVLLGLIGCTALTAMAGQAGFRQVPATPWFAMAHPLLFGPPRFVLLPALVMSLSTLVVMTETTGNCLAIGEITGRPIGPATLTAAFRADGLSTMVGGLFNSFPYNVYSQNTGLLKLSKIKSRYAVAAGGGLLVLLGFLPKLAAVIAAIPRPVLGGASLVMFGMTTMAGIEELTRVRYHGTSNAIIVAVSVSMGVLPIAAPQLFAHAPDAARLFLNSGIFLTAATAVFLNLFFSSKTEG